LKHRIDRRSGMRVAVHPPVIGRQSGLTLIELMVVVAIVGILAGIAVFMFTRQANKAKATEVKAVFAELKVRQEQYYVQNSAYTCMPDGAACDDSVFFPDSSPTKDARSFDPTGTAWEGLRVNIDRQALLCVYSATAGVGNDSALIGPIADQTVANNGFAFTAAPAVPWYYLLAECNLDGDPSVNSRYFARSDRDGIRVNNEGR
jgi:prepilin-type N-terminal cleavage/methylation domain-containing protein